MKEHNITFYTPASINYYLKTARNYKKKLILLKYNEYF